MTDIREILRRLQLGEPDRRIARNLGISRNTVARYRVWAGRHGVLDGGPLPDLATLAALVTPTPAERPAHEQSLVEPLRERVRELHERGVEGQAIWQLLAKTAMAVSATTGPTPGTVSRRRTSSRQRCASSPNR